MRMVILDSCSHSPVLLYIKLFGLMKRSDPSGWSTEKHDITETPVEVAGGYEEHRINNEWMKVMFTCLIFPKTSASNPNRSLNPFLSAK